MARSQTPQGSLRQRNAGPKKADLSNIAPEIELDKLAKAATKKDASNFERDHWAAFSLTTILAFVTRFWGISHPNEVVFDEVHFGKVRLYHVADVMLDFFGTDRSPYSSHHTISKAPTSSTCTLPLPSFCSPSWVGWSATMATSTSITLAIPTSITRCPTWLSELSPPFWAP